MVVGILAGGILRWGPGGDPGHPPSQASRGRRRLSGAWEVEPGEPGVSLLTGKELTLGRFCTYAVGGDGAFWCHILTLHLCSTPADV